MTTQPAGERHTHAPGHIEGNHVVTVQVSCELLAELTKWSNPVQAQIQHHAGHEPEYTMEFRTHTCPSERHTGTLNLTGEGNTPSTPITDEMVKAAAEHTTSVERTYFGPQVNAPHMAQKLARAVLEAAYPAIRQHVAEQIATKADAIAEEYQATAIEHRNWETDDESRKDMHRRTAHAFRNKADGAWAVAHAAREIGSDA